jgi:hypothetical protein
VLEQWVIFNYVKTNVINAKMKFRFLILLLLSFQLTSAQYKIENFQFQFYAFFKNQALSKNGWEFRNGKNDFAAIDIPLSDSSLNDLSIFRVVLWKDYCKGVSTASNFIVNYRCSSSDFEIFKPLGIDDSYKDLLAKFKGKKLKNFSEIPAVKIFLNQVIGLLAIGCEIKTSEDASQLIFEIKDSSVNNPTDLKRVELHINGLTITDVKYN